MAFVAFVALVAFVAWVALARLAGRRPVAPGARGRDVDDAVDGAFLVTGARFTALPRSRPA